MPTQRDNGRSKLISVRLSHEMIAQLKSLGKTLDRPYQTVMKEAIVYGMSNGLVRYTCLLPQSCVQAPPVVQGTGDALCTPTTSVSSVPSPRRKAKRENGIRKNIRTYEAPHVRETIAKLSGGGKKK